MTMVFYVPGSTSAVDYARNLPCGNWVSVHTGQPLEALQATYPGVVMGTEDEFAAQMEAAYRTEPEHITEERYQSMLDALPPQGWTIEADAESFKFMERYSGRITDIYARIGRKFFRFMDVCTLTHDEIVSKIENSAALAIPGPGPYGNCL